MSISEDQLYEDKTGNGLRSAHLKTSLNARMSFPEKLTFNQISYVTSFWKAKLSTSSCLGSNETNLHFWHLADAQSKLQV